MTVSYNIPPAPIRDPWGSYSWEEWFRALRDRATQSLTTVSWSGIDFTNSNITSILTRRHNDLQNIQGGSAAEYYHLTSSEYSSLQTVLEAITNVVSVAIDTTLNDTTRTVVVTADNVTITLPDATTARIGRNWTVVFAAEGTLTISTSGTDTIVAPDDPTEVELNVKGSSLTFKCYTDNSWVIV